VPPIQLWQQIGTNPDVRAAAASGLILTLIPMKWAERRAGLTRQLH
jgi:putative spermidine/putrescine transport system permease protein